MVGTLEGIPSSDRRVAIVTPSFARDFATCRELNESILMFGSSETKHYVIVDGCDMKLFRQIENDRTIVLAVEDVIPKGYVKLNFSKKWWFSTCAMVPAKGWLIQQLVKLSAAGELDEPLQVNVDSDVRFVRRFDRDLFVRTVGRGCIDHRAASSPACSTSSGIAT